MNVLQASLEQLKKRSQHSLSSRILTAIFTVGSLTLLVKLLSAGKDVLVAQQFGTSHTLDAYLIAFVLPSFAINMVAGSFQAALIPTFIEVREQQGEAAAQALFSSVVTWSLGLLIGTILILALSAQITLPILGYGFDTETLALSQTLFYLMLPSILFNGLAIIWSAVLNAGERFGLAALAPAAVPVVTALFLVLTAEQWGVYSLVAGLVIGFLVQAAVLAVTLKQQGFALRPAWSGRTPALRQVERQYLPMLAGAFLMGGTMLVDQSMATALGPGSVATLNYGSKLVALALNIGALSIGTVVLPYFSTLVASQDWEAFRRTLRKYTLLILVTSIPLTMLLVAFSEPLIRLVFQRGAFTPSDTQSVSQVQSFYFLQTPFYIVGIFMVRLISALKANHLLMWGSLISLTVNIVLNYVFIQYLGVSGIALSTTVVYVLAAAYMALMVSRLLRLQNTRQES